MAQVITTFKKIVNVWVPQVVTEYAASELDQVLGALERMSQHLTAAVVSNDTLFQQKVCSMPINARTLTCEPGRRASSARSSESATCSKRCQSWAHMCSRDLKEKCDFLVKYRLFCTHCIGCYRCRPQVLCDSFGAHGGGATQSLQHRQSAIKCQALLANIELPLLRRRSWRTR